MSQRTGQGAAVNPDNINMFYLTAVLTGVVFLASVTISFFGLYAVGLQQGLPPYLAWLTPLVLDAAILVFTLVSLIQRRRGNKFARFFAIIAVGVVTTMSMSLNFLHSYYAVGFGTPMEIAATVVNASAPLSIWVTTEMLVGLIMRQPPAPRAATVKSVATRKATVPATRKKPAPRTVDRPRVEAEERPAVAAFTPAPALHPVAPARRTPDRAPVAAFGSR